MKDDNVILNFFLGILYDSCGRSIQDILNFTESDLESTHDFIQWIFPTKEKSQYNPDSPILSENFKDLFLSNPKAQDNFCKTCKLFLNFIGIECSKSNSTIILTQSIRFIELPKHNLLRITRVLNSLNQVGKKICSGKILLQLEKINNDFPDIIPKESFTIWKNTQIDYRKI